MVITRSGRSRPLLRAISLHSFVPPLILLLALCAVPNGRVWAQEPARKKPDPRKDYALIFGTVWGPDDRPVYGVKVKIRLADKKHAKWELISDHNGEFAQRVPVGPAEYVLWVDVKDLKQIKSKDGSQLQPGTDVTVHISGNERADTGVHLR